MKKWNFIIFILITVITFASACNLQTQETQSHTNNQVVAINAYKEFMEGKRTGKYKDGRIFSMNDDDFSNIVKYAFYDYGHDGIPKLILDSNNVNGKKVLTYDYKNDHILFLKSCSEYVTILSNDSFLYSRHGGAPTHIDYQYDEFNSEYGVYNRISFAIYDVPKDDDGDNGTSHRFFYEDNEIGGDEWKTKTYQYLTILPAKITWYTSIDKQTKQNELIEKEALYPTRIDYVYTEFNIGDYGITQTDTYFSKFDTNDDGEYNLFVFQDNIVEENKWNQLSEKYLDVVKSQ